MSTWTLDGKDSSIGFAVRHLMFSKVHGAFTRWTATLDLDESDVTRSRVTVKVEAASIDTRDASRDAHLKGAEFLDVARFPEVTFESRRVESLAESRVRVVGPLTVHGVTKDLTLDVERLGSGKDPWRGPRVSFRGTAVVNRKDFGVTHNPVLETGGVLLADKIEVTLALTATLQTTG